MTEPTAQRPHMPGYGVAEDPDGLLPWAWAEERLHRSHELWLATTNPDGRPHVMPVWAVWLDGAAWISTSPTSRKARNLAADPRCTVTTDDTRQPVVIHGVAEPVRDLGAIRRFAAAVNTKYASDYDLDFFIANPPFRIRPEVAFGLDEDRFTETPTRWSFPT